MKVVMESHSNNEGSHESHSLVSHDFKDKVHLLVFLTSEWLCLPSLVRMTLYDYLHLLEWLCHDYLHLLEWLCHDYLHLLEWLSMTTFTC